MEKHLRILLVDDIAEYRKELSLWLQEILEHTVEEAGDVQSALALFKQDPARFDLALIDYGLSHNGSAGTGLDLMRALHRIQKDLPVIVITGAGDREIARQVLSEKAFWYLEKPLDMVEAEKLLDWVSRYRKTTERIEQLSGEAGPSHPVMAISHAIASAKTVQGILGAVKTKAIEFFGADLCGLLLVDPETDEVTGLPEDSGPEEQGLQDRLQSIARSLIAKGEDSIFSLKETSKTFKVLIACPCPPQKGGSEVLFALFRNTLSDEKRVTLQLRLIALARLVGVALERIRQSQLMEALVQSGEQLVRVGTEQEIFALLAEQIQKNFNFSAFYLSLFNRATQKIHCRMYFFRGEDMTDQVPVLDLSKIGVHGSWAGYVLHTNDELEIPDAESKDLPARPVVIKASSTRSYFGVPLRHQDGLPFGVLSLQSASARKFPESTKQALRALATLVSPAIDRVRRAEAARRRQDAENHIRSLMDRNGLVEKINETLTQIWPDNTVHVNLLLADRGNLKLNHDSRPGGPSISFGEGLAGRVAVTGETHLREGEALKTAGPSLHRGSRSALCVPVKLGDSLLGVLNVETPEPELFDSEDQIFLERIAKSIATTLVAAGRKDSAEAVINAAAKAASHPEEGLKILTRSAHEIASSAGGAPTSTTVYLLAGETLELVSVWPEQLFEGMYKEIGKLPLEPLPGKPQGYVARAALTKETQFVEKVILQEGSDPEGKDRVYDSNYITYDGKTRAELAVPVLAADQSVVGVLNLEYGRPEALNDEDKSLMETLADQAGIVAVLQKQAKDLLEKQSQRTTLVMLGVEAADREHGWINETAALRNELGNFVTAANRVAACASTWHYGLLRKIRLTPDVDAEVMRSIAMSLEKALGEYKELNRSEQHIQEKTRIQVEPWLREVVSYWSQRDAAVSFPLDPQTLGEEVLANKYWLSRALKNLISNAVRAAKKCQGANPEVKLLCYRKDNALYIEVRDNGPGIPKEVQTYLFKEMIPGKVRAQGRHGVGCLLTNFIAQEYGGSASFLPSDAGARVYIQLPLVSQHPSEG